MTQKEFEELNPVLFEVKNTGKLQRELRIIQGEFFKTRMFIWATLDDRSANILKLRFGIIDGKPWTLEEVAKKYGITRQCIRQIEERAIEKLKQPYRMKMLRQYTDETFKIENIDNIFKGLKSLISKDIVSNIELESLRYIEDIRIDELNIRSYCSNGFENNSKQINRMISCGIETCKDFITFLQSGEEISEVGLNDTSYRLLICAICDILSRDKSREISKDIFNGYIEYKHKLIRQKQEEHIKQLKIQEQEKQAKLKNASQHPEEILVEDLFCNSFCKSLKMLGFNTLQDIITYYNSNCRIRYLGYIGTKREQIILSKIEELGINVVALSIKNKISIQTPEQFFIEGLDLSLRTYNALKRKGINTLEDLLNYYSNNNNSFKSIRWLGDKGEQEIIDKLQYLLVNLSDLGKSIKSL